MKKRLYKKFFVANFILGFALSAGLLYAHGAKDVEEKQVENMKSWQESFDLSGKKKGKYNILITAKDFGGNEFVEGPYNLYVDPNSDLPVSGITNPRPGMRIVGNLNIVGTCIDDDAVERVELVLDGDEEHPVKANGKEFWSYYLDTTDLEEGLHTIKVKGFDVNGLVGNPVSLSWNLDRRQPVTAINNHGMGDLVSGTAKFTGLVTDGNGIKQLEYSVDGGQSFLPVRLKQTKEGKVFTVSVDTKSLNKDKSRKFPDGPAIIWFKATDNAGSVGIYSFLYFIDNTSPDIQIVYPVEKEVQNGKFAVAGYAKDILGVKELTWEFGSEKGNFELIPGNPYWAIVFDTTNSSDSSRKFTVTGKDVAGNVVSVSRVIPLDQKLDKPTVEIQYPTAETFVETDENLYVRGLAKDDDGVASVKFKLDGNDWIVQEIKSSFYAELAKGSELAPGKHRVTVIPKDKNGVEGNSYVVEFNARGAVPNFDDARIGGESVVNGMTVHPEAGLTFQTTAKSGIGLSAVHYDIKWGKSGIISADLNPNNSTSCPISIPLNADFPKGIVKIFISATDTAGRVTEYKALLDVVNTAELPLVSPAVVFDDSTVGTDGTIINNAEFPASGYFVGGKASRAEIVPATPFAKAELRGNRIVLIPGTAIGSSEPVVVRVTTDQGLRYESQKLVFKNDTVIPVVKISGSSETKAIDGKAGAVTISGSVACETGVGKLGWRVLGAKAISNAGLVTGMESVTKSELNELKAGRSFSFTFNPADYGYGIYFVEVIAESAGGNKSSAVVCVNNLPAMPETVNGKPASAKPATVVWADGEDVYWAVAYQGEVEQDFGIFKRAEMNYGSNSLTASAPASAKSLKYTANRPYEMKAAFALVGDKAYESGYPLEVAKGGSGKIVAYIDTSAAVSGANYEIYGDKVPGGAEKQTGAAIITKDETAENRWIAEIPLNGLPVRINKVKLVVKGGGIEQTLIGSVGIVRPSDAEKTDDRRAIYIMENAGSTYSKENGAYLMKSGDKFNFYSNTAEIVSADLVAPVAGLSVERVGNNVVVTAEKDGTYSGVSVRVKDVNGASYTSPSVNFLVDSGAPEVNIETPALNAWLKRSVRITGTTTDPSGVKSGEYSIDGGETWKALNLSYTSKSGIGATFSATADISTLEDGLVTVDVRVYDVSGKVQYARVSACKDTTPPQINVIVPTEDSIVNGDNLILFEVRDNGSFEKAFYVAPPALKKENRRSEVGTDNYVITNVGTPKQPIDESMSFEFKDDAGNTGSIESWKFMIDTKSDLPVTEIHLPEENEVVTRDFTISGVVYDDDGPSTIYYRIDRGEYKKLSEPGTSFAIDVPFSTMVDNEHTIYAYAVDINGVQGPVIERKFRVSTEEPKGSVEKPTIDTSVNGVITISGVASDKNGIDKVLISLDNGNTYNSTVGTENWSYTFDTRAIPNGTQVVFIKVFDKYGITGLYSSLINIDNLSPEMVLDYPLDDSKTAGPLFFSGYAFDNVNITEMYLTIRSLDGKSVPRRMSRIDFELERIIAKTIDLTSLENGQYNIELTALDKAGNATHVSRNVELNKNKPLATVDLLYPLNGEEKRGQFNFYGQAEADKAIESLTLYVDDKNVAETNLTSSGYFKFTMGPENIADGVHKYRVEAKLEDGTKISSRVQTLTYSKVGPWVTIDSFTYGDFAIERPFIDGHAGYSLDEDELLASKMKKATKEQKAAIASKKVAKVEISFDNGKTFEQVSKGAKWMYRVENQDLPEGFHFMIVRATMKNGETAIDRCIIQIDNTAPKVRLISPGAGGRYNQQLEFSGLSSDDVGLKSVTLSMRKGDKSSYEVPSFIQGLYLDWHFWGATLYDIGVGLTFFDDNVKLQFQWGQFTQAQRDIFSKTDMRYGGDNVMGLKILANVAEIPFSFFFGRDFECLSANIAIGANFTRFNESASGKAQILSALLAQVEFPKFSFPKMKMFSSFSLYSEFSLWFIPTDVSTESGASIKNMIPQFSEGIRLSVF
ncbi:MAG: Ig-like domain-containing protein [Treponema sp.]|nr:Ig-like domain-containing protein [Treponema sp.]